MRPGSCASRAPPASQNSLTSFSASVTTAFALCFIAIWLSCTLDGSFFGIGPLLSRAFANSFVKPLKWAIHARSPSAGSSRGL